ncbi:MAG: EF-hand domain-containing protein [Verrucomicrobiae bacterium]|nr:EF-hand domain-containing protein [Verrucomicrobiae bacterium]
MNRLFVFVLLTAGISTLAAQTEDRPRPQRPDPAEIFKTADLDKDGYLDVKEFTEFRAKMPQGRGGPRGGANAENDAPPPRGNEQAGPGGPRARQMPTAEEMFAMMDKDKDGKIAPDEFVLGNRRGPGAGRGAGPGDGERPRAKRPE